MCMNVLARWESLKGKYWVIAFQNEDGSYGFKSGQYQIGTSGGSGYSSESEVIKRAELESTFQPSKMKRIK